MTILYINKQEDRIEAICKREDPMWERMGYEKWVVPDTLKYTIEYVGEDGKQRVRDMKLSELKQSMTYADFRFGEYPPITDFVDGYVKGDQAQIDKYIADCLAVKAKYPKPSEE